MRKRRFPVRPSGLTRRELIRRTATVTAAAALGSAITSCKKDDDTSGRGPASSTSPPTTSSPAPDAPRIAIVGAGLAGMSCAYELSKRGVRSTLYEANPDRLGGRCWTARGWADGQTAEHGGEFIDTVQHPIRNLVSELGLALDDLSEFDEPGLSNRYYFDGGLHTHSEVVAGLPRLWAAAERDQKRIGPFTYDKAGRAARALDEMTGAQWLDGVLGADDPLLRDYIWQYMTEEYALDLSQLSAINMIWEFGTIGIPSDERFHVRGGNDQIIAAMADRLPDGTVVLDAPLTSLARSGGGYRLGFASGPTADADLVVLCAPFATLRDVDLEGSGLSDRKLTCIRELGAGTNSKVLMQFEDRLSAYADWTGEYYDRDVDTWDSTITQKGSRSILTVYSGGTTGASYDVAMPHGRAPRDIVDETLATIERAIPGLSHGYSGQAWVDDWARDPYAGLSYASFKPGQYSKYWGFVGRAEGDVHFGGEHTSVVAQGFLDGAVETGQRCAREVLAKL